MTTRRRSRPRRASGRPPGSSGEETRQRILEAARACFGEYGYKETSNRAIADVADLTAAVLYHYFDSKEHLFLLVQEQTQKEIQDAVTTALESSRQTFAQATEALLKALLKIHLSHPSFSKFNAVVRIEALRNPEIANARADQWWRRLFRELTDLGVRTGEIEPAKARLVRHALSSTVLGLTQQGVELAKEDLIDCNAAMVLLFEGTLFKPARVANADAGSSVKLRGRRRSQS